MKSVVFPSFPSMVYKKKITKFALKSILHFMKHFLLLIFFAIITNMVPITISASDMETMTVLLYQEDKTEHNNEEEPEGTRSMAHPLICIITRNGVEIEGMDISCVIIFESYAYDDNSISRFEDPIEFASYILGSTREMKIRFEASDFILVGQL